jgi:hypothetical protein
MFIARRIALLLFILYLLRYGIRLRRRVRKNYPQGV